MSEYRNRAEADRLLGIAEKLLHSRDFNGTRDFAILAQETEPLLEGSEQILAVAEVLLSSEKRINNKHDWYSILQLEHRSDDDAVKKQYRRLALLLHPDKNKFPFADQAFKLVADAWAVLSDFERKSLYDNELGLFSKVDLSNSGKSPVRRSPRPGWKKADNTSENREDQRTKLSSFWTVCPYCYVLFEYPRVYENCCLRCQSCRRAFHAAWILTMPPLVPGKEAYYCCWAFFPLGFVFGNPESGGKNAGATMTSPPGFPNWMPQMFAGAQQQQEQLGEKNGLAAGSAAQQSWASRMENRDGVVEIPRRGAAAPPMVVRRKRGRPRKYPLQV
uniref:Uncharacterized protein MANES_02G145200 n=1 Tax=Rhizophora mucronata TaxID=61149 RepID=A0A2P2JYL0_RHIMU